MATFVLSIIVGGSALGQDVRVLAADIILEANRIPRARVTFAEAFEPAGRTWRLGDSGALTVGSTIEVRARDIESGAAEVSLFKGAIFGVSLESSAGDARLTVEAAAGAHRLTQGRRSAVFASVTDEDAIRLIVGNAGLSVERFDAPAHAPTHEALVQHACTDWDFILARADGLGLLVGVADTALTFARMAVTGETAVTLELGRDDILDLSLELDAAGQPPGVETVGWDVGEQTMTSAATATDPGATLGDATPSALGDLLHLAPWKLGHLVPLTADELQAWADARLARRRMAMVRGRIGLPWGGPAVAPLDIVELKGTGDMFAGKALVSGVRHRILPGNWRTDVQLGLPAEPFAETPGIADVPAAGLLPPATALQIGVIADYEDDPESEYRAGVTLPAIGLSGEDKLWARLAVPEAGSGRGHVFRPMVGDEVLVGFLAGDPRQPVVLGAMFSKKNAPTGDFETPSADNIHKGIATKSGAALAFRDQDKPAAILRTKRGTIIIDDDAKTIELSDEDGNKVVLSQDGIAIKSAKDLTIEASGKVTIKGSQVEIA
jgi:phage protein D